MKFGRRSVRENSLLSIAANRYLAQVELLTSVAARPARGETVSGDRAFVQRFEAGFVLAVIDALGHGPHADDVAKKADAVLATLSAATTIEKVFSDMHRALRGTRGAAMTLVRGSQREIETAGIGNVGLRGRGMSVTFTPTSGILGAHHRPLRVARSPLTTPGRLVLFSDGISRRFDLDAASSLSIEALGTKLLSDHGADHDDATVLVADLVSM